MEVQEDWSIKLIIAPIAMIMTGITLLTLASPPENLSVGGVVFIGPLPIACGTGPHGLTLIFLVVILVAAMITLLLLSSKRRVEG